MHTHDGADDALRKAVSEALGRRVTWLLDVRRELLEYDAFLAHRTVNRLSGSAAVDGEQVSWSLIEKRTEGPGRASPYLLDNARREFAAYASGILDRIAPNIRAPRVWGTLLGPDGGITLWLEEVEHDGCRPLSGTAILAAARDLGGLAGRWLGREGRQPWYFTEWIPRHGQPEAVDAGLAAVRRGAPDVVERLGDRLARIEDLIRRQRLVHDALRSVPQTLCHHDAVGANVFTTVSGTVLIDWESIGPGPVGADLASLLFASVRRGDATADVVLSVLEDAVTGYADGLRAEGGDIAVAGVRRGFDAAVALRWKLAVDVVASIESGQAPRRGSLPVEPPETAMGELIQLVDILLDSASRVLGQDRHAWAGG